MNEKRLWTEAEYIKLGGKTTLLFRAWKGVQDPQISPVLHCQQNAYNPMAKCLCFVLFWNWMLNDDSQYQSLSSGVHKAARWPANKVKEKKVQGNLFSIGK